MFLDLPAGTYIAVVSGYADTEFVLMSSLTPHFKQQVSHMNEWGMIIFTALAGAASIYF